MAAVTSHENDLLTPFGSDKTLKFRGWKWGGGGGIDQTTETPYHKRHLCEIYLTLQSREWEAARKNFHTWVRGKSWKFTLTAILRLRVCISEYFSLMPWCRINCPFRVTTKGSLENKLLVREGFCSLVVVFFHRGPCKNRAFVITANSLNLGNQVHVRWKNIFAIHISI